MKLTIPNLLTLFRIALVPILVGTFYLDFKGAHIIAALMFAVGAITDWLDGWIARRFGQMSAFGAFLDPVADKLTVTVTREITISALREWMAEIGERKHVSVAGIGKFKTIVQMVAISFLLWREPILGIAIYEIGQWLLFAAAILTIWSAAIYMRAAWPVIRARDD